MKYPLSSKYDQSFLNETIMGPNPLKLLEELMSASCPKKNSSVLDLGCGRGVTSIFLVKEYGLRVYACDLWVTAEENQSRFTHAGLTEEQIIPVHADAHQLPFTRDLFDAIISVDSYHYFGRDPSYFSEHLLPILKPGGYFLCVVPGLKKDIHDNIPPEMLRSWTPDDIQTLHDTTFWKRTLEATPGIEILSVSEMDSFQECWDDWLACDNEYSIKDRRAMKAGAGKYMNFISMVASKFS